MNYANIERCIRKSIKDKTEQQAVKITLNIISGELFQELNRKPTSRELGTAINCLCEEMKRGIFANEL